MIKIYEVMGRAAPQQAEPVPTAVKQQARVGQLVNQMAAGDMEQHKPAGEEIYLATTQYKNQKKQVDLAYVERLRQQLAYAESQLM